jgi:phosphotriesterase-related protein
MPEVQTTAGPVDVAELGRTLGHEHLLCAHEGLRFQWPHLVDHDAEHAAAVESVAGVKAHDVRTICDPGCLDLNRDVRVNIAVGEQTGVRFVMATGIYLQHYTFLPHYFQTRDIGALVDCLLHDLQTGIQGTDVKAHFLKCAADEPGITDDVEKVHRAVAAASLQTGAPIMAHSRPASRTALDQLAIFAEEGVDPRKIQIAHCGDTSDLDYIEEVLESGCLIGLDRYGLDVFHPHDERIKTHVALVERGHADRLVMGADYCAVLDWYPEEAKPMLAPRWSMTFVFETVIPELMERGVTQEQIDASIGANVHAWLTA